MVLHPFKHFIIFSSLYFLANVSLRTCHSGLSFVLLLSASIQSFSHLWSHGFSGVHMEFKKMYFLGGEGLHLALGVGVKYKDLDH